MANSEQRTALPPLQLPRRQQHQQQYAGNDAVNAKYAETVFLQVGNKKLNGE